MYKALFLISVFISIVSCKNEKISLEEVQFKEEIPPDFLNFYDQFHGDSIFQMNHIIFPLQMQSDSTPWLKENWTLHKPFSSQSGEFQRKYFHLNGIVIEQISDSKGYYNIERRFSKSGNSYNLIYYKSTNVFEQSEFEKTQE